MFRLVSQIRIAYPDSPLSRGSAGDVAGGDRLPWVGASDNFAPLRSLDWQVHVYGGVEPSLRAAAQAHGLPLHGFGWTADAAAAGLQRDALYLIRPDGHVALAGPQSTARLTEYLSRWGLRTGSAAERV